MMVPQVRVRTLDANLGIVPQNRAQKGPVVGAMLRPDVTALTKSCLPQSLSG